MQPDPQTPELTRLLVFCELLKKWQRSINLVAPSTLGDVWGRHFADSLQILDFVPPGAVVADIGSGAGFPGLVLAIARPDVHVHLVESDQKKGTFLLAVSRETGAKNVDVHVERIERVLPGLEAGMVTARALAPLPKLLEMVRPVWERNVGANMVFMKGAAWREEVDLARQDHDFDLDVRPSKTGGGAAILCITKVRRKRIG
ncbi:MAG: 16S rRNA (guanine(527)-N(7))-methyltransferase RsmG [Rhodospirillales bacterium]|nr:16S rRNA (guanine(527)-N(7))-methyltransferase RsmG [Alphaproteobacteria bacterium]MCB9986622.1 16S rRNA (guanine(527)-N(7))-methyltransferase RsmG [Rhodospirillales bacterium]USO06848.1 MAG: 16S rRNA (guanine(527)-N(7))-methyltransferase RsmG [Rhodospirillales bacterium]